MGRKLNILLPFISKYYYKIPKTKRWNSTNYFIMKTPNKKELKQIVFNHSSDNVYKDFMKFSKEYIKEPY